MKRISDVVKNLKNGFLFAPLLLCSSLCVAQESGAQQTGNYCFSVSNAYVAAAEARTQGISSQKFVESYSSQPGTSLPWATIEQIANQVYHNQRLAKEVGEPLRRLTLRQCMQNQK